MLDIRRERTIMVNEDVLGDVPVCPVCGSADVVTDPPDGAIDADLVCASCGARTFPDDPEWFPLTFDEEEQ
jgi:transcription initiation factor TFIIIB Brf1 subunit/transcription initiation factor TFIIB